eukprot:1149923-Alexandrium_andersonii.AAC.1
METAHQPDRHPGQVNALAVQGPAANPDLGQLNHNWFGADCRPCTEDRWACAAGTFPKTIFECLQLLALCRSPAAKILVSMLLSA